MESAKTGYCTLRILGWPRKRARVVQAPYPPVVGAVILALLRAGVACDKAVPDNLAASWKVVESRHERNKRRERESTPE